MTPDEIQRLVTALTLPGQVAYMDSAHRDVRVVQNINAASGHAFFKDPRPGMTHTLNLKNTNLSDFRLIQPIP